MEEFILERIKLLVHARKALQVEEFVVREKNVTETIKKKMENRLLQPKECNRIIEGLDGVPFSSEEIRNGLIEIVCKASRAMENQPEDLKKRGRPAKYKKPAAETDHSPSPSPLQPLGSSASSPGLQPSAAAVQIVEEQVHNFFENYLTQEEWKSIRSMVESGCISNRGLAAALCRAMLRVGWVKAKQSDFALVTGILGPSGVMTTGQNGLNLVQELSKIFTRAKGQVAQLAAANHIDLIPEYPKDPLDLPEPWRRESQKDGATVLCPYEQYQVRWHQGQAPCRKTHHSVVQELVVGSGLQLARPTSHQQPVPTAGNGAPGWAAAQMPQWPPAMSLFPGSGQHPMMQHPFMHPAFQQQLAAAMAACSRGAFVQGSAAVPGGSCAFVQGSGAVPGGSGTFLPQSFGQAPAMAETTVHIEETREDSPIGTSEAAAEGLEIVIEGAAAKGAGKGSEIVTAGAAATGAATVTEKAAATDATAIVPRTMTTPGLASILPKMSVGNLLAGTGVMLEQKRSRGASERAAAGPQRKSSKRRATRTRKITEAKGEDGEDFFDEQGGDLCDAAQEDEQDDEDAEDDEDEEDDMSTAAAKGTVATKGPSKAAAKGKGKAAASTGVADEHPKEMPSKAAAKSKAAASTGVADEHPKDKSLLAFKGTKKRQAFHYGRCTVYTDVKNKMWRLKPGKNSTKLKHFSWKVDPAPTAWKSMIAELLRTSR